MVREVTRVTEETVQAEPVQVADNREHSITVAQRIIYFVGGIIFALIGLRILLSILGANQENMFANIIYSLSYPLVAPFFGLFNYKMQYGVSRFEFESLVALLVWVIVTGGLARLVTIPSKIDRSI